MSQANQPPRLLSGGNPQIAKAMGDAPVQAYIAAMPGWTQDIGRHIDARVRALVPDATRAVKWNSPFYGTEGQGWFLSFHCFTHYVKLTFFDGASLVPPPPEASKHAKVRYAHIRQGADYTDPQLDDWIVQASRLPGERL